MEFDKFLLVGALLIVILSSGCVNGTINENSSIVRECSNDSACIPQPGCHPVTCINKDYDYLFKGFRLCSGTAMCYEAHKAEDCACIKGTCTNKNLDKDCSKDETSCSTAEDCIPLPSECHPHTCINKAFEKDYTAPEMCTELFDCGATYKPEDCGCVANACVNENEGKNCE